MRIRYVIWGLLSFIVSVNAFGSPIAADANADKEIRSIYERFSNAIVAKDLDTIMSFYAADVVAFDVDPPREYDGIEAYKKDYAGFFAAFPGPAKSTISDLHIKVAGDFAYAFGVDHWVATGSDGKPVEFTFRFTDVFRKHKGSWRIVHEHNSIPVDLDTGKPDFQSSP